MPPENGPWGPAPSSRSAPRPNGSPRVPWDSSDRHGPATRASAGRDTGAPRLGPSPGARPGRPGVPNSPPPAGRSRRGRAAWTASRRPAGPRPKASPNRLALLSYTVHGRAAGGPLRRAWTGTGRARRAPASLRASRRGAATAAHAGACTEDGSST